MNELERALFEAGKSYASWTSVGSLETTDEGRQFMEAVCVHAGIPLDQMEVQMGQTASGCVSLTLMVSPREVARVEPLFKAWKRGLRDHDREVSP